MAAAAGSNLSEADDAAGGLKSNQEDLAGDDANMTEPAGLDPLGADGTSSPGGGDQHMSLLDQLPPDPQESAQVPDVIAAAQPYGALP